MSRCRRPARPSSRGARCDGTRAGATSGLAKWPVTRTGAALASGSRGRVEEVAIEHGNEKAALMSFSSTRRPGGRPLPEPRRSRGRLCAHSGARGQVHRPRPVVAAPSARRAAPAPPWEREGGVWRWRDVWREGPGAIQVRRLQRAAGARLGGQRVARATLRARALHAHSQKGAPACGPGPARPRRHAPPRSRCARCWAREYQMRVGWRSSPISRDATRRRGTRADSPAGARRAPRPYYGARARRRAPHPAHVAVAHGGEADVKPGVESRATNRDRRVAWLNPRAAPGRDVFIAGS
jgi:hypothetical protein